MTENEAIKNINALNAVCWDKYFYDKEFARAMAKAVKALHEIQQYRAIGTVEQLEWCKDASHWKELFKEKLEKYEAIGTVEEFKELKEKEERFDRNIKMFNEIGLEIRNKAIDEFADKIIIMMPGHKQDVLSIAEKLKGGGNDVETN